MFICFLVESFPVRDQRSIWIRIERLLAAFAAHVVGFSRVLHRNRAEAAGDDALSFACISIRQPLACASHADFVLPTEGGFRTGAFFKQHRHANFIDLPNRESVPRFSGFWRGFEDPMILR